MLLIVMILMILDNLNINLIYNSQIKLFYFIKKYQKLLTNLKIKEKLPKVLPKLDRS
jgi:hypothetical protein